jgi:hypothetical protein
MSGQPAQVQELRTRYPVFRYERFEIERRPSRVTVRFRFSVPPDISFTPEIFFEHAGEWHTVPDEYLRNAVFHLGLVELLSYWKATASPVIEIQAGGLSSDQIAWWEDLLIHGMGEFFFRNAIDFTVAGFVRLVPESTRAGAAYPDTLPDRSLLTIGGGRDSALAAGVMRNSGQRFTCMMLNPSAAATAIADKVTAAQPVVIRRSICPDLLELNRRGFLNGHTPFSAYLGFLGAVGLLLYGYSNVIVANERSSDEGNTVYRGRDINHQYSKSFRFEKRFDEYLGSYIASSGKYFSLVRPLYELQIAKLFANFSEFFSLFKSCNRNRSASWCGECPKCLSVFITMYPFISRSDLLGIFGMDLFHRETSIALLRQVAGLEMKPFECVGTTGEIVAALALCIQKVRAAAEPLPPVLDYAAKHIPGIDTASAAGILESYGEHRLPPEFQGMFKSG